MNVFMTTAKHRGKNMHVFGCSLIQSEEEMMTEISVLGFLATHEEGPSALRLSDYV